MKAHSTVSIKGGDEIWGNEDSTISTIGFCATQNNVEGFVFAGHAGDVLRESFRTPAGTILGFVTATAYYNGTIADAAFITKSSASWLLTTNKIHVYTCNNLATNTNHYPVGTVVCKYGISTRQTSGKIEGAHFTGSYDGVNYIDHVYTDYWSEPGDSGGPVFVVGGVVNGKITCQLMGIHSGGSSNPEYPSGVFAKYMNIVNELDITAITE